MAPSTATTGEEATGDVDPQEVLLEGEADSHRAFLGATPVEEDTRGDHPKAGAATLHRDSHTKIMDSHHTKIRDGTKIRDSHRRDNQDLEETDILGDTREVTTLGAVATVEDRETGDMLTTDIDHPF